MAGITVRLSEETKDALERQKLNPSETIEQVIQRLAMVNCDEALSPLLVKGIEEGLADIRAGRIYTTEHLDKELGL